MSVIYLVGQISPKYKETYEWRERVELYFNGVDSIKIINPCKNYFNTKLLKNNEYAINGSKRTTGLDILVSKDYTYVLNSDIAIVNMNQYDVKKPLIGSFFELAWLFANPEKTVIAFTNDLNAYECQHPFVKQAVTVWCNNEQEACELIEDYFI